MGLDLFAHGVDPQKFKDLPPVLCGSMFTAGQSSIRGKVYAGFISDICDVNIYQQKLPEADLQRIITRLNIYCLGADDLFVDLGCFTESSNDTVYTTHVEWCFTLEEVKALLDWFRIVKENNGQVLGWW